MFTGLDRLGLTLELARITTEKEVAMDTFYVCRARDGAKVTSDREIESLQRALHEAAAATDPVLS